MPYIADIWDVVKCVEEECEEFYIVIFNVQDAQNLTIFKSHSGQLSLSTKLFKLDILTTNYGTQSRVFG